MFMMFAVIFWSANWLASGCCASSSELIRFPTDPCRPRPVLEELAKRANRVAGGQQTAVLKLGVVFPE
jgi:hypothetical protein